MPESRQNVQVARLEAPGVMAAAFSPLGTYLATFQRTRPEAGNTEKNLKVHPSGCYVSTFTACLATTLRLACMFRSRWRAHDTDHMQQAGWTCVSRETYVRALRQLWDWRAGKLAIALYQKAFSREAWPTLQLLPDESLALSVVTNAINVYNPRDFAAGAFEAPLSSPSFHFFFPLTL